MKRISPFLEELNKIQCRESIEFRLRFHKKWLLFRKNNCNILKEELLRLMLEYQKFKKEKRNL